MSSAGSITLWLTQLKTGDQMAAQKLWECCLDRLVRLARKKPQSLPRRAADEADVVLSAFDSFCRGAEQGRFPQLADRDDLWQILVMITAAKPLTSCTTNTARNEAAAQCKGSRRSMACPVLLLERPASSR